MVFARGSGRRRIAAQVARPIDNFLMNVANHHLQIEIFHRLATEILQLLEMLAQNFERSGLASFQSDLSERLARRVGLLRSIHRKEILFRDYIESGLGLI